MGFLVGLIYLISSINILKLKNWARVIAVYLSGLIGVRVFFIWSLVFIRLYKEGFATLFIGGDTSAAWGLGIVTWVTLIFLPAFLFLIFFTRPKVKRQFMERNPERSEG